MRPRIAVAERARPAILVFFHDVKYGPVELLFVQTLVHLVGLGDFLHAADGELLQKCIIVVLGTSFAGHKFGV